MNGSESLAELLRFIEGWLPAFLLVMARTVAMVTGAPVFGSRSIPANIRAALGVSLSFVYLVAFQPKVAAPANLILFSLMILSEIFAGMLFSFAANVLMMAVQAAGEFMDVQMGLSMVMLLNPATRTQSTAIGRFLFQIGTTIFIISGAHLILLGAFFHSFDLIPLGGARWHDPILPTALLDITVKIYTIGVQLAMPLIVIIFVVDFGLGTMNRVSPQINVLEMNMILKPLTGSILIMVLMPTITHLVAVISLQMVESSNKAMKALAGPPSGYAQPKSKDPAPGIRPGIKF